MNGILPDKPIARGRTAEVFNWDDGSVLKLFLEGYDLESVEHEQKISRAVHASGVKAPAVGSLVHINGRHGLIYERMTGESMLDRFQRQPWTCFSHARILASLHAEMHNSIFDADVPTQHAKLRFKIERGKALPDELKHDLLQALEGLPAGDRVCHGDFHPGNVLLAGRDASIIDWIDASSGNPLADAARTTIIFRGAVESGQITGLLQRVLLRLYHSMYVREYFRLRLHGREEYRMWMPVVAAARLSEGIAEQENWLYQQAEKVKSPGF